MTEQNKNSGFTPRDQAFLQEVVKPLEGAETPSQGIIFLGGGQPSLIPRPELTEEAKRDLEKKERNIRQHKS